MEIIAKAILEFVFIAMTAVCLYGNLKLVKILAKESNALDSILCIVSIAFLIVLTAIVFILALVYPALLMQMR